MSLPLDPFFDHIVNLLRDSITNQASEGRGALTRAVRVLPLLCREARDLSRTNPLIDYLLAYCAYIFQTGPRLRYCDGLPQSISPHHQSRTEALQVQRVDILGIKDLLDARQVYAKDIDTLFPEFNVPANNMPVNLPPQVVLFVLCIQADHAKMVMNNQYPRFFMPCQRNGCNRPALRKRVECPKATLTNEQKYWQTCHSGSATGVNQRLPENMHFCCETCFRATQNEYYQKFGMLADIGSYLPIPLRHASGTSPSRLYRAALARNASLYRQLRVKLNVQTVHYPLTPEGLSVMYNSLIDVVNIDLGILYAAAVVFELPLRLRPNATLPSTVDWRETPWMYTNAIQKVRAIYTSGKTNGGVAKGGEPWMERVKTRSLDIF